MLEAFLRMNAGRVERAGEPRIHSGTEDHLRYLGGSWSGPMPRSSHYHMQMIADYLVPGGYIAATSSNTNVGVLTIA